MALDRYAAGRDADAAFERLLLDSARADAPPPGATSAAWASFAALTAGGSSAAREPSGPAPERAAARILASASRARTALGWLVIGALGGSALTALWMRERATPGARLSIPAGSAEVARDAPLASDLPARVASAAVAAPRRLVPPTAAPPAAEARRSRAGRGAAASRPSTPVVPAVRAAAAAPMGSSGTVSSGLEREVEALDVVSLERGVGDYERALQLLARYRADFPAGELARDADVLEIQTLFDKGDASSASFAAQQFLSRYPADVHVPRVHALTAASATRHQGRSGER